MSMAVTPPRGRPWQRATTHCCCCPPPSSRQRQPWLIPSWVRRYPRARGRGSCTSGQVVCTRTPRRHRVCSVSWRSLLSPKLANPWRIAEGRPDHGGTPTCSQKWVVNPNSRELTHGEVRKISLLGTSVNKPHRCDLKRLATSPVEHLLRLGRECQRHALHAWISCSITPHRPPHRRESALPARTPGLDHSYCLLVRDYLDLISKGISSLLYLKIKVKSSSVGFGAATERTYVSSLPTGI
jgi:hypothetical protein